MRCLVPTKAAMPTFSQPSAKTTVPTTTTAVTGRFTFTQPDAQKQNLCTSGAKLCSFTSPSHSNWSDVEKDWDGETEGERKKEQAEREKADNKQNSVYPKPYYPPSPQYVPSYDSKVAQALTDTLVPVPEQKSKDKDTEQENIDAKQEIRTQNKMRIQNSKKK